MTVFESFRNREVIPEIARLQPRARDNIFLADVGGFEARMAGLASERYLRGLREGDLSRVAESERLMEELAAVTPHSRTFANVASVVGALPIVPAFLAGQPENMRLRRRMKRPAGPLAIFLESTCSGGAMGGNNARGAAMLALVRLLNEYRPVDLWICTTYGQRELLNGLLVRIETRPLDLARAAHMLASLSDTAQAGWALFKRLQLQVVGGWSYGVPELERRWCGEIFSRFLQPGSDVLYVPAAYLRDRALASPVAWLQDMLVRYGGETTESEEVREEREDAREC